MSYCNECGSTANYKVTYLEGPVAYLCRHCTLDFQVRRMRVISATLPESLSDGDISAVFASIAPIATVARNE